jgi:uncharacterized protein YecE (DUF72 family)
MWVGTAGWSISPALQVDFPGAGGLLERYSRRFACCEINSTFHKRHRPATYQRWAASVPDGFRFILKMPKTITHGRKLRDCQALLDEFLEDCRMLGPAVLLIQLPPSLAFEIELAERFFADLRQRFAGGVACEPRHPSWFTAESQEFWQKHRLARVAADPARVPAAAEPGGWRGFSYFRWHGWPRMYYSSYESARLSELAAQMRACPGEVYCIFDNTAAGAGSGDALRLVSLLQS